MEKKLEQQPTDLLKIVLFGPESTGKTTLAKDLAKHYNTNWVPEYAREYLQAKWETTHKTCEPEDLIPIAIGQMALENKIAEQTKEILICDTDLLETKVYSEAYYIGSCDPVLEAYALKNTYHLYLLTYIDIPWEKDDLRDKPDQRDKMFAYFRNTLIKYDRNFVTLKGTRENRLKSAINAIENLKKNMIQFTDQDLEQLRQKGISKEKVLNQVETFKAGIPFVNLIAAAVLDKGINKYSTEEEKDLIALFQSKKESLQLLKFVPASGAASRMFKAMFNFIEAYDPKQKTLAAYIEEKGDKAVQKFVSGIKNFPFYEKIIAKIGEKDSDGAMAHAFVTYMLSNEGLNYGFYPKGLLPFHQYEDGSATPFEEHLKEAALYAASGKKANLHFTISPQHQEMFAEEEAAASPKISKKTGVVFNIGYSNQKPATDTLAVNLDNTPFRNQDGSILFRPGGHGALIENLNDVTADIIFIKNIDNVVIAKNLEAVANSKKMLAGVLLQVQKKAFDYAAKLEATEISSALLDEIANFLQQKLNVRFDTNFEQLTNPEKTAVLKAKINRPIRVCGMVKNEGEPGGGPFFIQDGDGNLSLQIIESAQINTDDNAQMDILNNSTHFNPVDLVCGVKNYKGEKYNLLDFVDSKQGFITGKTKEGKELKALELPGLWNGAMAYWNTIFVEVPLVTFNPVKTVNDLLKPTHQV